MKTRLLLHAVITLAVLAVCNGLVWQKERLLAGGRTVLLRLAPVDPRSLIQGDYMALRYEIASDTLDSDRGQRHGTVVIRRDANGVVSAVRPTGSQPLAPDELLLKFFRARDGRPQFGAESYFFQEGKADLFAQAKYGELKVAPDGGSVLVGLRDEALQPLPRPVR